MKKNILWRVIIIAVITLVALYIVLGPRQRPTVNDFTLAGINNTLRKNIRLGLDLRGGSHLVMQVKTEDYLNTLTDNAVLGMRESAKAAGYPIREVRKDTSGGDFRVVLEANDASKLNEMRDALSKNLDPFDAWSAATSGNTVTWTMTADAKRVLSDQAVDQALTTIESRINAVGVAEPTLQRHGAQNSHQILLQMPGIQDPERVKKLLIADSRLELVHVVSPPSPQAIQTYPTEEEAIKSLGGNVPSNRRVLPYAERDEPTSASGQTSDQNAEKTKSWVVVEVPPIITGSDLRGAQAVSASGRDTDYQIAFELKPSGEEKFGRWTGANINQYMGVVLAQGSGDNGEADKGEVKSIAYIKSQITNRGEISGSFTKQSAEDLALTLRSGALPARLVYQEERTVGPSLGQDSINSGVRASIAGLLLVIGFMVFYYRGAGVNAVIALLLNLVLTMAALVIFDATLTLPGIAGLILTIGMAVDSNVLIFERIREELGTGKTVASSTDQGFARAFVTIIDTHVTVVVSALFLFVFGTGPIRGFAVTLVLGLLANLFSAVYVSRTIFLWLLNRKDRRAESLSI